MIICSFRYFSQKLICTNFEFSCFGLPRCQDQKIPKIKETIQGLIRKFGAQICENSISLEVRSTKTWELVQNKFNPQFYEYFDIEKRILL